MTPSLRPACETDALACAQIICAWGAETPWMVPLDAVDAVAASWADLLATDTAWVAEVDVKVAGFCVREDDTITGLYVASDARSQGVGKALMDAAKAGQDRITVWVYELNEMAWAFYKREGFVQIGREKDEHSDLMYLHTRWTR